MPADRLLVFGLLAVLSGGCGSAHLEAGRRSLANGNLPAAIEFLDRGTQVEPDNRKLRQLAVVTRQNYGHELQQEIDRLVGSGRFLLALGGLLELEELSRRAEEISLPGEVVPEVERQRLRVAREAVGQLRKRMDRRSGRGISVKADLADCRQLLALTGNDRSVRRACDRLRAGFKLVAVLESEADSWPAAAGRLAAIARALERKNPELIELVDRSAGRHNARMEVWVGQPRYSETPWLLKKRNAFVRWIPRKDSKGRPITETVIVRPTAEEIAEARKNNRPRPKLKKIRKKVWESISGEFRVYHARRELSLPYRVQIHDLNKRTLAVVFSGRVWSWSQSSYYEYEGDPRGERSPPVPARGRRRAPDLLSRDRLIERALDQLPGLVVEKTIERVE